MFQTVVGHDQAGRGGCTSRVRVRLLVHLRDFEIFVARASGGSSSRLVYLDESCDKSVKVSFSFFEFADFARASLVSARSYDEPHGATSL